MAFTETHPEQDSIDAIRTRWESIMAGWDESSAAAVDIDTDFVDAYLDLVQVPGRTWHLDDKARALIMLATTAAVTTLDAPGIRTAAEQAHRAGATRDEAMEAVHLTAVLGIHSYVTGIEPIADVVQEHVNQPLIDTAPLTQEHTRIRETFTSQRGYWSPLNETLLRADPEWFSAYTTYSSHPWMRGALTPKVREFIYIAIDLSCTHLFDTGVRPHIENAIRYGATVEELLDVLAVIAPLGFASVRAAAPIVRDVFATDA